MLAALEEWIPPMQQRAVAVFLLNYPLAWLYLRFARPKCHIVCCPKGRDERKERDDSLSMAVSPVVSAFWSVPSVAYVYWLFGLEGVTHILIATIGSYVILASASRSSSSATRYTLAFGAMVGIVVHMSICHAIRQFFTDRGTNAVDISGPMMVLTIKITSFAWNVLDGIDASHNRFKKYAVSPKEFPSLLEFCGFLLFFPSIMAGPALEFKDYRRWALSVQRYHLECRNDNEFKITVQLSPRYTCLPALKSLWLSLVYAALHLILTHVCPVSMLIQLKSYPFWQRLLIIWIIVENVKMKFYFVWTISSGALKMAGFGVEVNAKVLSNHENNEDPPKDIFRFDSVDNVDVLKVESETTFSSVIRCWNRKTHHWLKNYVYLRVLMHYHDKKKDGLVSFLAVMSTYIASSLWHGFYPGYYFTFVVGGVVTLFEGWFGPKWTKRFGNSQMVLSSIILRLWQHSILSLSAITFVSMTFMSSITIWLDVYCWPIIAMVLSWILFKIL